MSRMNREDMLRELELLPVWQLRQPLPSLLKVEIPAAAKSEQLVTEPMIEESVVQEQDIPVSDLSLIEINAVESAVPELSIPESSILEPAPSAASVPETQVLEASVPQQLEVVESIEQAPVEESAPEQIMPLPLRLLLSEDSLYAFLMTPYATDSDVQEIETLLQNMIRAMQVSCRVDVTDTADKIFAVHTPRLIICLGAEPANRLSGKIHTIVEWRNIQQQNPPLYEQIPLLVTYHPAHLLVNTADKALAWRDLCVAMKLVQNL